MIDPQKNPSFQHLKLMRDPFIKFYQKELGKVLEESNAISYRMKTSKSSMGLEFDQILLKNYEKTKDCISNSLNLAYEQKAAIVNPIIPNLT